ncbi:type II toxin-antitoxin system PemK/MazF family toxin [Bacillus atrophaeus]|uniref:type II toxin-antitoxin system PemK/MazF family toxin n=1 Tax=Bacillus atrophaeus TaxID=1452 RepID=UPI001C0F9C7D|nr:type II toxin-antitoxin system PemK/MazF family toxin [Bacillus atrophaeus]MBU5262082.1 type II toxin-antitoxin system PemK/MazF family toxin [Bacillus atrophaeus]MCY8466514.1 type II toxin-antitoxin system PemK/MazF family toxin [Bacillus atrophaeus]MCY8478973.1 type II toxin-antitoxin system PemK/MazF family toxin [Bacillus atrophaeus]
MPPKPGEIYNAFFHFENGSGGKYRPVLVMDADSGLFIAVAIKVTTSKPKKGYTDPIHKSRLPIKNWKAAGLTKKSYAQCSTFEIFKYVELKRYIGRLTSDDFQDIYNEYLKYTS